MGKSKLLVDTDVCIDYLNHGLFREVFDSPQIQLYYSVVTKKELLSKQGLKNSEKKVLFKFLSKYRMIVLDRMILKKYSEFRKELVRSRKEDCLIAATALTKKLPLFTRNRKHYLDFSGLTLYP